MNTHQAPPSLTEQAPSLFSKKSILIGTFLAGPLAAGWMLRANLNALGREREGDHVLLIGILYLGALLASIFLIPDEIPDRVMNILFPALTTGLAALALDRMIGPDLQAHATNKGLFHSAWRVCVVTIISLALVLLALVGIAVFMPTAYENPAYEAGMQQFNENEQEALGLYYLLEEGKTDEVRKAAEHGIELWLENIQLLNEMNALEDIPLDVVEVNNLLIRYCQLRVQAYSVIAKSIDEDTSAYEGRINVIHQDIEELLE